MEKINYIFDNEGNKVALLLNLESLEKNRISDLEEVLNSFLIERRN